MKKLLFPIFLLVFACSPKENQTQPEVVLAILAHPDDEIAMGPVLAKYALESNVHLMIGMDGRYGTRPGFPTGDSLVLMRQEETRCACKELGIMSPHFLGYSDELSRLETPKYMEEVYYLKQKIKEKIEEINPDIILTFGPDGDTGQSDHRLISNTTTEVILNEGWADRFKLYYLAWGENDSDKLRKILGFGLNTVNSKYYNVSIPYSEEDEAKLAKSLACYKSQMSDEDVSMMIELEKEDTLNTIHFRRLITSTSNQDRF